jgi:hypothetical protein
MGGLAGAIEETLRHPEKVVESLSDPEARLYYRFYVGTRVGDKWLCVVVKLTGEDAFVLTAYLNDRTDMAERKVRIWYDPEGDYLEVIFDQKPDYFRETSSDQVMEKVDEAGNLLGFSVMKVSALKKAPLEVTL